MGMALILITETAAHPSRGLQVNGMPVGWRIVRSAVACVSTFLVHIIPEEDVKVCVWVEDEVRPVQNAAIWFSRALHCLPNKLPRTRRQVRAYVREGMWMIDWGGGRTWWRRRWWNFGGQVITTHKCLLWVGSKKYMRLNYSLFHVETLWFGSKPQLVLLVGPVISQPWCGGSAHSPYWAACIYQAYVPSFPFNQRTCRKEKAIAVLLTMRHDA